MTRRSARPIACAAALAVLLAGALWWVGERHLTSSSVPALTAAGADRVADVTVPGAEELAEWDRARSRAFAAGSPAALRRLYVPGSSAGTTDVAILRGYADRGLRVQGMRMQVLSLTVLARSASRLRVRVTDRLVGAVAVGPGVTVQLPRDQASTRTVVLRRTSATGRWRVASVTG